MSLLQDQVDYNLFITNDVGASDSMELMYVRKCLCIKKIIK